eukprot:scaffold201_cov405-Prasinococcus_capsulatus_cf.AAC.15
MAASQSVLGAETVSDTSIDMTQFDALIKEVIEAARDIPTCKGTAPAYDVPRDTQHRKMQELVKLLLEKGVLDGSTVDMYQLHRFLRARKFDVRSAHDCCWSARVEDAAKYVQNMLQFRVEKGLDDPARLEARLSATSSILGSVDQVRAREVYQIAFCNNDKEERPVLVANIGEFSITKVKQVMTVQQLIDYHIFRQERLSQEYFPKCCLQAGRQVEQVTAILDFSNFSMFNFGHEERSALSALIKNVEPNYPESLSRLFIVNAPMIFRAAWTIVKPWLEERTVKKFRIFGSTYEDALLEAVDAELLPKFLGGELEWHPRTHGDAGHYVN